MAGHASSAARATRLLSGPALPAWTLVASGLMGAWLLSRHGLTEDGFLAMMRATARLSALLFALAFLGPPARRLWPSRVTRRLGEFEPWLLASLVVSHLAHLAMIAGGAWATRGASLADRPAAGLAAGAGVYLVLIALGVGSVAVPEARRGRAHRAFRTMALYLLWLIFFQAYALRVARAPLFALLATLLALGLAFRIAVALRDRARRGPA